MFCSLRSRRSPCQSTDSCTLRIIDTCRCDSTVSRPLVHETETCSAFCFLHHLCRRQITSTSTFMSVHRCCEISTICGALPAVHVDVLHLCVGDFWQSRMQTVSLVKRSAIFACLLSLSNSSLNDTPYSTVLLRKLLSVLLRALLRVIPLHSDTLLLDLLYGYVDAQHCVRQLVLAEYAGSPHQFLPNLRNWHDNPLLLGILHG